MLDPVRALSKSPAATMSSYVGQSSSQGKGYGSGVYGYQAETKSDAFKPNNQVESSKLVHIASLAWVRERERDLR